MVCLEAEPAALSPSLVPAGDTSFASFLERYLPVIWCSCSSRCSLLFILHGKNSAPQQLAVYILGWPGTVKLPKSSHPALSHLRPSAMQLGRYIFRRKARKPVKFNHRRRSQCCEQGMGVGWQSLCVWSPSSNSLCRSEIRREWGFSGLTIREGCSMEQKKSISDHGASRDCRNSGWKSA